jgi:hypothetical protein
VFFGLASVRSSFVERACAVRFSFFLSFRIAPTPGQPGGVRAWSGRVEMPSAALLFSLFFFFLCCGAEEGEGNVRPRQGMCVLAALHVRINNIESTSPLYGRRGN